MQQQQNTLEVLYVIIYNFFQLIICKFLLSNVGIFLFSRPIKTVSPIKIQQFIDYLANPIQTNLARYFLKSAGHYPIHAQHRASDLTEPGSDSHLCISIQHYRKPTVVAFELELLYVISTRAINETFFNQKFGTGVNEEYILALAQNMVFKILRGKIFCHLAKINLKMAYRPK